LLALTKGAPPGVESRPYAPAPSVAQETRFDLVAEITAARRKAGQTESRRCDPVLEARFANPRRSYADLALEVGRPWLERQGRRLGFDLVDLHGCDYEVVEFVRQGRPLRIGTVRFAGRLRVTEPVKFTSAMLDGIGHGKAWGCGLLLCFGA
jgi:CRISPR system Cascade subunit CasE